MLRHASSEDANTIAEVLVQSRRSFIPYAPMAHTEPEIRTWIRATLIPGGSVVVWEEENKVVGFISTSTDENGSWIDQLYVLPGWTGRGIGNILLRHAQLSLARPIRVYTFQLNLNARRFYERHGYEAIKFSSGENNEEGCPDILYELPAPQPEA